MFIGLGLRISHCPFWVVLQGLDWVGDLVNLLPLAQRTKTLINGVDGRTWVVGREYSGLLIVWRYSSEEAQKKEVLLIM